MNSSPQCCRSAYDGGADGGGLSGGGGGGSSVAGRDPIQEDQQTSSLGGGAGATSSLLRTRILLSILIAVIQNAVLHVVKGKLSPSSILVRSRLFCAHTSAAYRLARDGTAQAYTSWSSGRFAGS